MSKCEKCGIQIEEKNRNLCKICSEKWLNLVDIHRKEIKKQFLRVKGKYDLAKMNEMLDKLYKEFLE